MNTNRLEEVKQEHTDLASRVKQAEDRMALVPEMEMFLQRLRSAGSEAPLGDERELLSSLASYWAGLIYEYSDTGKYPSPELDPYTGTTSTMDERRRPDRASDRSRRVLAGLVITVILATLGLLAGTLGHPPFGGWLSRETPSSAVALATRTQVLVATLPMYGGATATVAVQRTPTPLPATGIDVQLVEPVNGETVLPTSILRGTYENLQPGWSIFAILQPLSESGRLFPVSAAFVVPDGMRTGEWEVDPGFSKRPESRDGERYQIYIGVALDGSASNALRAGAAEGFGGVKELPQAALVFETNATVGIDAFRAVDEVRLVFSGTSSHGGKADLMTTLPDGSDLRQITWTAEVAELDPDLSPDGKTIVYVGLAEIESHAVYSLLTVESSGSNATRLLDVERSIQLHRPKWSPDGRFIAYGALAQGNEANGWGVYLFDTTTHEATLVSGEANSLRHPSWFPDGKTLVLQGWSDSSESYGIYKLDITTGAVDILYNTGAQETHPELSDDGSKVAFVSYPEFTSPDHEICWLDLRTGKAQVLTPQKGFYWEPTWHPDMGSIYFEIVDAAGAQSIWVAKIAGGKPLRIAEGGVPDVGHMMAILSAAH